MCGFVGIYSAKQQPSFNQNIVETMRDSMSHRGPDGAGIWVSPEQNCILGHRRLSIVDLSSSAAQPMSNHDGSIIIVFNGEIYNHKEIRRELSQYESIPWRTDHSDTEVILYAYQKWGLNALNKFYGIKMTYGNSNPHAETVP